MLSNGYVALWSYKSSTIINPYCTASQIHASETTLNDTIGILAASSQVTKPITINSPGLHECRECYWSDDEGLVIELYDGRIASTILKDDSNPGHVAIFKLQGKDEAEIYRMHDASITAMAVLRDGCLVTGSQDKTIKVWPTTAFHYFKAFLHKNKEFEEAFALTQQLETEPKKDELIKKITQYLRIPPQRVEEQPKTKKSVCQTINERCVIS